MNSRRHFQQGSSTFTCHCCGRRTRIVDQPEGSDLCPDCYELYGLQNMVWDGCANKGVVTGRAALLAEIGKKGGDVASVTRKLKDLFNFKAEA